MFFLKSRPFKIIFFFLFTISLISPGELPAQIGIQLIKIRILRDQPSLKFIFRGNYYLEDVKTGEKFKIKGKLKYVAKPDDGSIIFSGRSFDSGIRIVSLDKENIFEVNNKKYRGGVILKCSGNKLSAVNELDLELYLYGVLPKEVIASWPKEALKSQAVISRTYALKNMKHHSEEGFDLCDETHCQVYGGVGSENQRTNEAVDETKGEVLFYEGKLASTFFHDSCGGYTENIENVWGTKAPEYLKGRPVKYANSYTQDFWKKKIRADILEDKLSASGFNIGEIKKIKISGKSRSGRAKDLKIYGTKKTFKINAAKFRFDVDPLLIRSTLFVSISKKGDYFEFSGLGWGHGVGLCQQSARNMAQRGYKYEKILKYFYPGTYLASWDEQE